MQSTNTIQILQPFIANNSGILNPEKEFQPFGILAMQGSCFYVGTNEWLNKNISEITLQLNWLGLPESFATYYKEYVPLHDYTNASFKVRFSVLHSTAWHLLSEETNCLFEEKEGKLLPQSTFHLKVNKELFVSEASHIIEPLMFDSFTRHGFIKMELIEPEYGFGGGLYSNAVSAVALENAQGHKKNPPLPPFVPVVEKLSVTYTTQ